MNPAKPLPAKDANGEVSVLIETLLATEQRLEELTAGEVDTVADREGRTFLLRRAQEQLRRNEAVKQAAILNALPANIALLDTQGIIISVNEAWRQFAKTNALHAPGHGVGLNYLTICDRAEGDYSSEAHQVATGIRSVLDGANKSFSIEYPCHSPAEQRWFLLTVSPLGDNHPNGAVVMHLNITERKRLDETLSIAHSQLQNLLEHSPAVMYTLQIKGEDIVPIMVSANITRLLGYTVEETKSFGWWAENLHQDDQKTAFAGVSETIKAGSFTCEYRIKHKKGNYVWVEDSQRVVYDIFGEPKEITGVWVNITERKRSSAELENINRQLIEASRRDGMAEIATNVLHNVGNVLNSVNISAGLIVDSMKESRASGLERIVILLQEHAHDLGTFLSTDSKGKHVPALLAQLSEYIIADQKKIVGELHSLRQNVEHIKEIVAMQQNYATFGGAKEIINVVSLVEDSLRMNEEALRRHRVEVIRDFENIPLINTEKHKILQILINLLHNAKEACRESGHTNNRITVRVDHVDGRIRISIIDTGVGITAENLIRIFNHGFTTKKNGHGFGLHSGALAANEMGGSLTAQSDGPGLGATFTLDLPGPEREI